MWSVVLGTCFVRAWSQGLRPLCVCVCVCVGVGVGVGVDVGV